MTEYTRPATWDDLKRVAEYLNDEGVEYALIGGYAIAAHGFNRFSEDLDILVNPSRENATRWIRALSRLPDRATAELAGQDDIFEREGHYAIRVNDEFTVLCDARGLRTLLGGACPVHRRLLPRRNAGSSLGARGPLAHQTRDERSRPSGSHGAKRCD